MANFIPGIWILVILLISPVAMGQDPERLSLQTICGTMKNCSGQPEGGNDCVQDCDEFIVTYAFNKAENNVKFELYSKNVTKYVAVGISKDPKMGEDSVVVCLSGTSEVLLKLGVNPSGRKTYKESPPDDKILKEISKSSSDGLKCVFSLPLNFKTQGLLTDFNKGVHIFLAAGLTRGDAIRKHQYPPVVTNLTVIVDDPAKKSNCNKTTPNLLHLIGTMFLTFIFISPALGTFRFVSL